MLTSHLPRPIEIVYRRLPNDVREFPGILRKATRTSLMIESPIPVTSPRRVLDTIVADSGFLAIWFIYAHRWYDVGKFYDGTRNWIGYYCDIIRPLNRLLKTHGKTTTITDLFLDLWITPERRCVVLDEDELENALKRRYLPKTLADQARKQVDSLIQRVHAGRFPPPTIQRVKPLRAKSKMIKMHSPAPLPHHHPKNVSTNYRPHTPCRST